MARTRIAAGNWKMNLTSGQAGELAKATAAAADDNPTTEVIVCPSFTLLAPVQEQVSGSRAKLGAQHLHWEEKGAFTGEVSAPMLLDAGCSHVIIGHSERRQYFGETEETVNKRIHAALDAGLVPIVCVGETLEQREADKTEEVVRRQVEGAFEGFEADQVHSIIIAYEPVWAIGTGKTATPDQAQQVHALLRRWVAGRFGEETAGDMRILYGGSVKPGNAAELFGREDIDGGLVGGASLKAEDFAAIIEAAAQD